jgi:hypothetical protein
LLLKKAIRAAIPNFHQVINHAHIKITPVTGVKSFKSFAGKTIALKAEIHLTVQ